MSYSPSTIANFFIKKYSDTNDLTPMKLIKLTYIAYGWYMAITDGNKKLVSEQPQAWDLGPVMPSLYHNLKKYGASKVNEPIDETNSDIIRDEDVSFLEKIWSIYGQKDAIYLSAITHTKDTPWSEIYPKGYNLEIPDTLILQHYKSKLKKPEVENNHVVEQTI
jgi:uncharacterized phage-associated protein